MYLLIFSILRSDVEDDKKFEKMPKPKPGDWLYVVKEKGQTFEEYKKITTRDKSLTTIYIQPLGDIHKHHKEIIEAIREYVEIFYGQETKVMDPIPLPSLAFDKDRNQYDAEMILSYLVPKIPKNAIAYVGFTEKDLFVKGMNFVFGLGSHELRVGVYSLNRYSINYSGAPKNPLLRRSLNVAVHELGHIFNMEHCIYYRCVMNGSNSLQEADKRPMHLCPICLKKVKWYFELDTVKRYKELAKFYHKYGFEDEAKFVEELINDENK
jgi:archaemetzincin